MKITVHDGNSSKIYTVSEIIRASDFLKKEGVFFPMPCGGNGRCLNCRIKIRGKLSEITEEERKVFGEKELAEGMRLACYTFIEGDCDIFKKNVNEKVMNEFYLEKPEEISEKKPEKPEEILGVAFDIGTTTVCGYLYDLQTGRKLSETAAKNAQTLFGGDVISRIEASIGGMKNNLQSLISEQIGKMVKYMCDDAKKTCGNVKYAVLTGNTAMLYLLNGKDTCSIAKAPFEADTLFGADADENVFITELYNCNKIYLPRCIGAYVGADITCAEICTGIEKMEGNVILADIGTNGEIVLKHGDRMICCSTAAGPAFEGSGLSSGVTAGEGAVSHVRTADGKIVFETIGGANATGFCGSGIIDAVAVMLELGMIDCTGRIEEEFIVKKGDEDCVYMCGFLISQKDIRSIQMGKAAICAGMETLMKKEGISSDEIDSLLIAGGFGSFINVDSAEKVGMIPKGLGKKSKAVGNAAAGGAVKILLSLGDGSYGGEDKKTAAETATVDLTTDPDFSEMYIENMLFC